jgi:hypothetical protein
VPKWAVQKVTHAKDPFKGGWNCESAGSAVYTVEEYTAFVYVLNERTLWPLVRERTVVWTASVVIWSEFLAANPEVAGSIPGATTFSE